jgi:hypothetical protein
MRPICGLPLPAAKYGGDKGSRTLHTDFARVSRRQRNMCPHYQRMVGVLRFERRISWSQATRIAGLSHTPKTWCPRAVLNRVPMLKRHLHHLNASKANGGDDETRTRMFLIDNQTPNLSAPRPLTTFQNWQRVRDSNP